MHYPANAFAIDPTKPTIIVPEGITIDQRDFMSDVSIRNVFFLKKKVDYVNTASFFHVLSIQTDALEINKHYGCTAFL